MSSSFSVGPCTTLGENLRFVQQDLALPLIPRAGEHTLRLVVDVNDTVSEADESNNTWEHSFTWQAPSQPDLIPYQPAGWESPLVPSSASGTRVTNALYTFQSTYIDWAVLNNGASTGSTLSNCLYYDGSQVACWNASEGMAGQATASISDWMLNLTPSAGQHTLELRADAFNAVAEANENNNSWEHSFTWLPAITCGPFSSAPAGIDLPDDGTWVNWNLLLESAGQDALVIDLRLAIELEHPHPEEVQVYLAHGGQIEALPAAGGKAWVDLTEFDGQPAEGAWTLWLKDTRPGSAGRLAAAHLEAVSLAPGKRPVEMGSQPSGRPMTLRVTAQDAGAALVTQRPPSPELSTGWSPVFFETFEGAFPGPGWSRVDSSSDGCDFLWGADSRHAAPPSGTKAAWPARSGANGLDPAGSLYPPNLNSWLIYGPFSLGSSRDAHLAFDLWRELEQGPDYLFAGVSVDGSTFQGLSFSGATGEWDTIELDLQEYAGQDAVWIGFQFHSNSADQMEGAWIDNAALEQFTLDCSNGLPHNSLTAQELMEAYSAAQKPSARQAATSEPEPYRIDLQSRQFTPRPGTDPELFHLAQGSSAERMHILVQFYQLPTPAETESWPGRE